MVFITHVTRSVITAKEYKKIYILNKPTYYKNGAKRKLVCYCSDCYGAVAKGGLVNVVDYKYGGYYEILDAIKESGTAAISFEQAVMSAYNRSENIGENRHRAEPDVSVLKRYRGGRRITDNNISFDDTRLWEFRYKLQYEEPRVKVVNSSGKDGDTLSLMWNKDYEEV